MANGYCPAILKHVAAMSGCDPSKRLAPQGFLQSVLKTQDDSAFLSDAYAGGHIPSAFTVKYRERIPASAVVTTEPDCTVGTTSPYKEFTPASPIVRSTSFWVPMATIRQYCQDASQYVTITGANTTSMNKQTRVMQEVYDQMLSYAGALVNGVDLALVTSMSTQFGVNVTTGVNTATAIDFDPQAPAAAFMNILNDLRENEFCDFANVSFVGTGPFINTELFRDWWKCCNQAGMDMGAMTDSFRNIFYDKNARTVWGTDHVGVFDKGSTAIINAPRYIGNFAGRFGTSEYFTMNLPVSEFCCPQQYLDRLTIDVQIKEHDCNPTLTLNGGSAAAAGGPGVMVMLSWHGALFVRPDMYATGDPLDGTNGTLRYVISEPVVTP